MYCPNCKKIMLTKSSYKVIVSKIEEEEDRLETVHSCASCNTEIQPITKGRLIDRHKDTDWEDLEIIKKKEKKKIKNK